MMNRKLFRFLHALTPDQQKQFAALAGTSVGTLRHYVSERRFARSGRAIVMEKAAARMSKALSLPPLTRADLSIDCRGCEYRKRCVAEDTESLA